MEREKAIWIIERLLRGSVVAYLFVMSLPHTAALRSILLGLGLVFLVAKSVIDRKIAIRISPIDDVVLFFSVIVIYKTFYSIDPDYSLEFLASEFFKQIVIFYLVVSSMRSLRYSERLLITIILSGLLLSLAGIYGYFEGAMTKNLRATSYLASPGRAAFYASLIFPILWASALYQNLKHKFRLVVLIAAMALISGFMILTMARGAWVSVIATILLLTAFRDKRLFVMILILLLITPWILPSSVIERAVSIFHFGDLKGTETYGDRYWMWVSSYDMIKDRLWFGAGYGIKIFHRLYPSYMDSRCSGFVFDNAHNQFIQVAVEMGLVGLFAFVLLLVKPMWMLLIRIRRTANPTTKGYMVGILGSFIVFILYSMTSVRYENEIGLLVWYILGCAVCLIDPQNDAQDKTDANPRN